MTAVVTLVTYHDCVRSTAIGVLLSGKRLPRALPWYDEQGNFIRKDAAPS